MLQPTAFLQGFFSKDLFLFYMSECLPACMSMHHMYMMSWRSEEGVRSSRTRVTDGCELLPCGWGVLWRTASALTAEPSLQPPNACHVLWMLKLSHLEPVEPSPSLFLSFKVWCYFMMTEYGALGLTQDFPYIKPLLTCIGIAFWVLSEMTSVSLYDFATWHSKVFHVCLI